MIGTPRSPSSATSSMPSSSFRGHGATSSHCSLAQMRSRKSCPRMPLGSPRSMSIRKILKKAGQTKNVKEACTEDGLLDTLDRLQVELAQCKKSLQNFWTEAAPVPRFYFVSEADLLDLLSNASTPSRIMRHITKLFLATKSLELTGGEAGNRPKATRFIAGVGVEEVMFEPAVGLDGKQYYLQKVLEGMRRTLAARLRESHKRYPTQERGKWLLHMQDDEPVDPARDRSLVSAIYYANDMDQVFSAMTAGNPDAIADYKGKVVTQLNELIKLTRMEGLTKRDRRRVMSMITLTLTTGTSWRN